MPPDGRCAKQTQIKHKTNDDVERRHYAWICDMANKLRCVGGALFRTSTKDSRLISRGDPETCFFISKIFGRLAHKVEASSGLRSYCSKVSLANLIWQSWTPRCRVCPLFFLVTTEKDIFSADKCGLQYKMAPDKTFTTQPLLGRKKQKDRITVPVCCNADSSETFERIIVGKAVRPRPFKKHGLDFGLNNYLTLKARMTLDLFLNCSIRSTVTPVIRLIARRSFQLKSVWLTDPQWRFLSFYIRWPSSCHLTQHPKLDIATLELLQSCKHITVYSKWSGRSI